MMRVKFKTDTTLSIAAILLFATIAVVFYFARTEQKNLHDLKLRNDHTKTVLRHSRELFNVLIKNETATRGYALSGDTAYLRQSAETLPLIKQYQQALRQSMLDHPELKGKADSLELLLNNRLSFSDSVINMRRQHGLLKHLS